MTTGSLRDTQSCLVRSVRDAASLVALDEMLAALQGTSDYAARVKLAQEFERYVIQEKFYGIPWGKEIANIAFKKCLKNVPLPQTRVHNNTSYATAWLDQDEC